MNYTTVGKTGIKVSKLALGTMSFGTTADKQESKKMFEKAIDYGINFFDSANVYGGGQAEEFLGEFMGKQRNNYAITTKVFWPGGPDQNQAGLSKKSIIQNVEQSLKRLNTDYIDFYFLHDYDPATPMETTLSALEQLVKDGKILYPAVSNWAAWQIAKALGIQSKELLTRFELVEPMYSLVKRQAEVEILPLAKDQNLGVISYSPLGAGLLTGKYLENKHATGRLTEEGRYIDRYAQAENQLVAKRFVAYAEKLEVSPITLAVAWVAYHEAITAPIIGARNVEQLQPSLEALAFKMTPAIYEALNQLSITPQPATDRSEVLTGKWK
ncbi:aldo/keto reductase [Candidatus Enterococcus ferrettii]|uniref:NADP-dependent oxidoreductase domain-containing protein n=1 Tax=Candidatus Enterococcus ferrettii TaxID=2815324 RepID=A0ABV0EPH0_9ENTE|nr:aldo/keto reductase [Enterococcus sp. 665A]